MQKWISLFLFFLFSIVPYAQSSKAEIDSLINMAVKLYSEGESDDAISNLLKAKEKSKTIGYNKGFLNSGKNLMRLYSHQSNDEKVIEISVELEKAALRTKDYLALSDVYMTRASTYQNLGFYAKSKKEYYLSLKYTNLIPDKDARYFYLSYVYYNLAGFYEDAKSPSDTILFCLKKGLEEIEKVKDNSKTIPLNKKQDMICSSYMNLGMFYMTVDDPPKLDSAEIYFHKALKMFEDLEYQEKNTQINLFTALGELSYAQKRYDKAAEFLEKVLDMTKVRDLAYERRIAYEILAKSYLELGDNIESKKYMNLFTKLNDSLNIAEKQAVKAPLSQIISEKETEHYDSLKKILMAIAAVIILATAITAIAWTRKNKIIHQKYEKLVAKINTEKEQNNALMEPQEHNETKTSVNITDETAKILLLKLEKFETSDKYLRKDISLTWLTNNLNTNTKYLSEIIKQHRGKTFTNYINGLRIDYIVHKLVSNPQYREYKVSYLAEECGYASRQVFVICFKKETGFTPSYFIEKLKKQKH